MTSKPNDHHYTDEEFEAFAIEALTDCAEMALSFSAMLHEAAKHADDPAEAARLTAEAARSSRNGRRSLQMCQPYLARSRTRAAKTRAKTKLPAPTPSHVASETPFPEAMSAIKRNLQTVLNECSKPVYKHRTTSNPSPPRPSKT